MGYTYCVFGAGRQGVAVIHDLIQHCEAKEVWFYDPDPEAIRKANKRLGSLRGSSTCPIKYLTTLDDHTCSLIDWKMFDVMISCAPWMANLELTKFAVTHGVPFCDLGGNPDTVAEQEKLETQTAIVPDCGLSPGISNILAAGLAKLGCDNISVRCGGIPMETPKSKTGLNYKLTFDPMGLISEYSGQVPIIVDGCIQYVDAVSKVIPYMDDYECAHTSNNSPQVVESLHCLGVRNYDYMTIRYPGHWNVVQCWKDQGFLQGNSNKDRGLVGWLKDNPRYEYDPNTDRDKILLSVIGIDSECGFKKRQGFDFVVTSDTKTLFSAMELMTSWGITMVAHYMAKTPDSYQTFAGPQKNPNRIPDGFATPERFVPIDCILDGLKKRLPG